jgi:hypothetical protein
VRADHEGELPKGSDGVVSIELPSPGSKPAEAYADALPEDLWGVFYVVEAAGDPSEILDPAEGRPDGQPLFEVTTPQGLLVEGDAMVAQQDVHAAEPQPGHGGDRLHARLRDRRMQLGQHVYRVPAAGGTPEPITRRGGEGPHSRPALHPDGRHFVFHGAGRSGLFLGDLRTAKSIRLTTLGASAVFATRDYLIYDPARLGTPPQTDRLVAQRFDVDAGRLVGPVTGLADNVAAPLFEASYTAANGVLVYQVWGPAPSLTWSVSPPASPRWAWIGSSRHRWRSDPGRWTPSMECCRFPPPP